MVSSEPSLKPNDRTFFVQAMLFETSLGFLGIFLALWLELPLFAKLEATTSSIGRGVLASLPLIGLLALTTHVNWGPLVRLKQQVETLVHGMFSNCNWIELLFISLAAGLGEELLFRGFLQPWIAGWSSPFVALVVVSCLFGVAHAVSKTYFVAATLMGLYLGWLADHYHDLVAPILTHALYDFVALLYYQRRTK